MKLPLNLVPILLTTSLYPATALQYVCLHDKDISFPAGLPGSLVVLMAVGMITSIALFPIGIVLLIITCSCYHGNRSCDECYDSSYRNAASKYDRHLY